MELKFTLRLLSGLQTPLQSDTLFGLFCLAYRDHFGAAALETAIIGPVADGKTGVQFSGAFPAGTLPRPRCDEPPPGAVDQLVADLLAQKRCAGPVEAYALIRRKTRQVSHLRADFFNYPFAPVSLLRHLVLDAPAPAPAFAAETPHATVDRLSGGAAAENGFYHSRAEFFAGPLDLYARFDEAALPRQTVEDLVGYIGLAGYGKNASTGAGRFAVEGAAPVSRPGAGEADTVMSLSSFIPCDGLDPLAYTLKVKSGRLEPGHASVFKTPFACLQPGALCRVRAQKPVYGRVLKNIAPGFSGALQDLRLYPLPVQLQQPAAVS